MSDFKKILDNSLFAKNSVVVYTFLMATLGGLNAIGDIYQKWKDSQKPDVAVVVIEALDFQDEQFDKVVFNFRNATGDSTSINNVGLLCENNTGQVFPIHAFNNEVSKHKQIFDVRKFDVTPKHLKSGESLRLDVLFQKLGQLEPLNHMCSSIAPLWSDNEFNTHKGSWVELSEDTVSGSIIVFDKS